MEGDFGERLRRLRQQQGWTVAEMSYRTGIPKRSLDKYLAREGASLPGLDALERLSKGLGVSLDWLVFGADQLPKDLIARMIEKATAEASLPILDGLLRAARNRKASPEACELLSIDPEILASDIAMRSAERALQLREEGATLEDLQDWKSRSNDRLVELMRDRAEKLRAASGSLR